MVNNYTNINQNHISLQLIEWCSTIPPISTKITSHFNSLSDGQQFHQYQQKSPLTSTHWMMVNNSTNINKNHLSPELIEWWSTIPPISTKITSHLNSLSGIVDHHSMSSGERWFLLILVELLTITQWVKVRGDFCWYWWNCWPSLNVIRWEVIFVDIGGIVDHHSTSWGERWFLLILVKLLTITQCIEMGGDFCWYWWNCWPSLNELKWDMIVVDIGGIVDHHSMSWGERCFLLILVELLTITQWVQVRGDFCWYWWNCWPSLNELRWEVIVVDIGGNCWPSLYVI